MRNKNWTTKKLKDICSRVDYGFTASANNDCIGPKFLRITDIVPQLINWGNVPFCKISEIDKNKYLLIDGDIVVARTGATTGYAKYMRNPPEAVFASYLVRFRVNESNDKKFVGHVIQSELYKKFVTKNLGGSAQPQANAQILGSYELALPPLPTQTRIASVLSAYDDLIENNEKRIKALEEMAQLLYTEWFVKFKFPGHEKMKMVESSTEYGMVPEGWEVVTIENLLGQVKRKLKIQSNEYLNNGSYPVVDQGKEFIGGYTENEDAIYYQDLIVFGDHSRCFKYCNFPFASGADGTQLLLTNDSSRMSQPLLYYIVMNSGLTNYNYARHFKFLKAIKVIKPDANTAQKFGNTIAQSFLMIRKLRDKNYLLSKTRDLLIPQLVTGRRELKT